MKSSHKPTWKPSEYKLSPMEGRIVLEIDEAGSEMIVTLVATFRETGLFDLEQLLPKFASAIERLHRLKLVKIVRDERLDNKTVAVSLTENETASIFRYLSDCSSKEWFEAHEHGPCKSVEACANFQTRG